MNEPVVKKESYLSPEVVIYELALGSIIATSPYNTIADPRNNESFGGEWE